MSPARFVVAEGLLINHTAELRDMFDIRVYLNPPEDLRRRWKVTRDCSRRGIQRTRCSANWTGASATPKPTSAPSATTPTWSSRSSRASHKTPAQLDAHLFLRDSLPHPDLTGVVGDGADADDLTLTGHPGEQELRIPGTISAGRAVELEEAIWNRMQFASHLRTQRLGEFTIGSDLRRSEALGLTQLLLLYHLVTARAVIALGGHSARATNQPSADRSLTDPVSAASP
jgi:phosphoribulokinase